MRSSTYFLLPLAVLFAFPAAAKPGAKPKPAPAKAEAPPAAPAALPPIPQVDVEQSPTLKKILAQGSITLGHRESSIPFSYYDQQRNVIGYSHELMLLVVDEIKKQLKKPDLKVQLNPVTSANRISLVQNGTIDIECGSTTNNLERQQQVGFSNSIFVVNVRLLVKKDSPIKDFADLAGKTMAVTTGTTSERLIRTMNSDKKMNITIIGAKDHGEAFLMLETGRAVAFMMDDALLYGERAKSKSPTEWIVVGTPASREAYGCMLPKGDTVFKQLVDAKLAEVMKNGKAAEIYKKWFERPIPPKNVNMDMPLSNEMKELYASPNDRAL